MQVGHAWLLQRPPDILLIPGTMKKRSVMTCSHRVLKGGIGHNLPPGVSARLCRRCNRSRCEQLGAPESS